MRLFVAIQFTDKMKEQLCDVITDLKKYAVKGNFTHRENIHLTLAFIGETEKLLEVKQAMATVDVEPFMLNIAGFGKFMRNSGDIYWVGAEKTKNLLSVYGQLYDALTKAGFILEDRAYTPHLTLGRGVRLQDGFDISGFSKAIPEMSMLVNHISLMKSERINDKLVYTEMYTVPLGIDAVNSKRISSNETLLLFSIQSYDFFKAF